MKKTIKIIVYALVILGISGCGKSEEKETDGTKLNLEGMDVTIFNVQVNEDTKTVRLEALYSEDGKLPEDTQKIDNYTINPCSLISLEQSGDSYIAVWKGIYNDISQIEDMEIGGFKAKNQYTCHIEKMEKIEAAKFEAEQNGVKIEVAITPFSISVIPAGEWIGEEEYYAINAVMKTGEKKRILHFPILNRNPMNQGGVEYLGDEMQFGMELEYGGITMITHDSIDIEEIESVEIESYQ